MAIIVYNAILSKLPVIAKRVTLFRPLVKHLVTNCGIHIKTFQQLSGAKKRKMALKINGRALHYVFKIGDRPESVRFFKEILGMKVLRHEEFEAGCNVSCNGPYDNSWSKTMVGYGPEDSNFVFELTYNYPVHSYEMGNDFIGVYLKSQESLERAKAKHWPIQNGNVLVAPGGYKFFIINEPQPKNAEAVVKVSVACANLKRSIDYWNGLLGLKIFHKEQKSVQVGFKDNQTKLELVQIDAPINRADAYGRIAFSCPHDEQPLIDSKIQEAKGKIVFPLTSLDTPGKATVRVIILADPDDLEICFVDDGPFRALSKVSPADEKILETKMKEEAAYIAKKANAAAKYGAQKNN